MRLPYICVNRTRFRMFRPLLSLCLLLIFQVGMAQHVSPGHYCRLGKENHSGAAMAASSVQDSIHIQHYDIRIDSVDFSQQKLWAVCKLTVQSKVDQLSEVRLSLDGFTVDSISDGSGVGLSFTYDDLNLTIDLASFLDQSETDTITIVYHGNPAEDPSWGGFYWNGTNYAFNMGVGFDEDPHVFGRAWFPCLDVFTDRATYDFHIKVWGEYQAYCNGELTAIEGHGNETRTYHWHLSETIPTYLASMAVAKYHFLEREYAGIPTVWAALPQDTIAVLNTFLHLPEAVDAFISSYGPYRWNKIGYALVPFNAGAMEHASSIHIGKPFVNGALTYETLWAHELAHMWWGDLVTCKDQENMWLNEGFAAYSEALFTEAVYGEDAYKDWIRSNHRTVLQFAHVNDGAYLAMNAITHNVTYGSTVYEKGPEVIHTLRKHMGDSVFFVACKGYMDSLAFGNANSEDLRDIFSHSSGLDLDPFFDGWVFEAGFPHFSIDSFSVTPIFDAFSVEIHVRQKQRANAHIYEMPIEVNLTDGVSDENFYLDVTGETQSFVIESSVDPKMITVDRWEKMSDAIADFEMSITTTGSKTFDHTNVSISVQNAGAAPSLVRIADHFVQPDGFIGQILGIALNPYHYWSVDGIFSADFHAEANFKYNGTTNASQGFMDNDLIIDTEDSLVFLYREGAGIDWQEVNGYEVITGSSVTNKIGTVRIDTLKRGEYVLARRDFTADVSNSDHGPDFQFAYPNPSEGNVRLSLPNGIWNVSLIDPTGKTVKTWSTADKTELDLSGIAPATYLLNASNGKESITQKLMVR